MNADPIKTGYRALPDFNLLLSRLEQRILAGDSQKQIRNILNNKAVRRSMSPDQRIRLAGLAQMAGEIGIACEIFADLNRDAPDLEDAWHDHLELLHVLDKPEEKARILAMAKKHVSEDQYRKWARVFGNAAQAEKEDDITAALQPFNVMQSRRESLGRFMDLFSGREDCFARQWVNKKEQKQGYVPVRRAMESQDLEDHLRGNKTYGMYLFRTDGMVKTGVIDFDLAKQYRSQKPGTEEKSKIKRELSYSIDRICEISENLGLHPLIEFSGSKGYHFWYFFNAPARPEKVRSALEHIRQTIAPDISAFSMEVFPKQDHLKGKGLGNLVKLPLGVHRLTGKRSYLIQSHARTTEAQLDFLFNVKLSKPEDLNKLNDDQFENKVYIHPRWEAYAKSFPELHTFEIRCPPLAQIIASCRNGKDLSTREEKIIFQTIGFLSRSKTLLHHLLSSVPDYNPHFVDYRLSRVRGTPLGCRRIHSLMDYRADLCPMDAISGYQHPLLLLDEGKDSSGMKKSEKLENLSGALENLKTAIISTQKFLAL